MIIIAKIAAVVAVLAILAVIELAIWRLLRWMEQGGGMR